MNKILEQISQKYNVTNDYKPDGHCGPGSTLYYTHSIRSGLIPFLFKHNINSILDCPCGNFNWMETIDFGQIKYIGADIVAGQIELNKNIHPDKNFVHLDITEDDLPYADLLFCRDCLFHFTTKTKIVALSNFVRSNIPYILMSNHPNCEKNVNLIGDGDFKEINWKLEPFNFPDPIDFIDDSGQTNKFSIRKMNLYSREQIQNALSAIGRQMETKKQIFNGNEFEIMKGCTHPDYSYFTFDSEEAELRDKYWKIKSGDVVFDIGASYGSYALTARSMGATVYAFEPEKSVYCDLVSNIELNNWQDKCFAFNIGLWSYETTVDMKEYAPHWPKFSISEDYSMKTLDQLSKMNMVEKLDWIKIDVEGAEEHVIKGGMLTISRFKPKLFIECHVFLDPNIVSNIKKMISSLGNYEFEEISRDPCVMLYAFPKE